MNTRVAIAPYVANVGMFEYSFVEGFDPANVTGTALPFPAFGAGTPDTRREHRPRRDYPMS